MKFYIKPQTYRECEIWDSGWRCGLTLGIVINIFVVIVLALYT